MFLLLLLACTSPPDRGPTSEVEAWIGEVAGAPPGLSGLTVDDEGRLWAVAERPPALAEIVVDGEAARSGAVVPIEGLGGEPESVAWTPDGFVVGTERRTPARAEDGVYRVRPDGQAEPLLTLSWSDFGIRAPANQGIEGACAVGDIVVLAGEPVIERGGARYAPIARWDGGLQRHQVRLATRTGKLSALACREVEGAIEVYAIERHYGVLRLLRFRLGQEVPEVVPLPRGVFDPAVNWEGLAWHDERLWMIADNQGARVTGPTRIASFRP